jgi:hypothetical protein
MRDPQTPSVGGILVETGRERRKSYFRIRGDWNLNLPDYKGHANYEKRQIAVSVFPSTKSDTACKYADNSKLLHRETETAQLHLIEPDEAGSRV